MRLKAMLLCLLLVLVGATARAEDTDLSSNLFEPELILRQQEALGLSDEQKNYIKVETRRTQTALTELQWKLEDGVEKLSAQLKAEQINEPAIIAQLDKVLGLEQEIKRTQMTLLIRLKNKLTAEQQARLRELKVKGR